MRVLFATQSESLRVFDAVCAALHEAVGVDRAGFVVADSWAYLGWLREAPDFESRGHELLKEWEVTSRRGGKPDLALLARYEERLGVPAGLFGAIVADRRLLMGPDCTYSQDYRRRFSDDELLCILEAGLISLEQLFQRLKPQLAVGFICVTMLDYLVYLFARANGVPYLNVRPTRIGDRVTLGSTLNDPTPEFMQAYREARTHDSPHLDAARAYVRRVREEHGRYEGVIRPSDLPALKVNRQRRAPWRIAGRVLRRYAEYRRSVAATDNHVPHPLRSLWFSAVVNPCRARYASARLKHRYVGLSELRTLRYCFYPLHTEPEVSLLVYGRPFLNQIEVIRTLALSLPVDMVLVVKEHPWMVGKRTMGAYQKLLDIPRVRLVSPAMDARALIASASLVAVVTGSVALEAAILGKPVITFGECPYNALPPALVQRCKDLRELPQLVRSMLSGYARDDAALEAYVAAVYATSESVNLYSVLLEKQGVHQERGGSFAAEARKLADYVLRIWRDPAKLPAAHAQAAVW